MPPYDLCVVIPTYNERENLVPLFARLRAALEGIRYEVIVVDDDSPDGTAAAARVAVGERTNMLVLSDGHRHLIPVEDVQGLRSATKEEIGEVEILGRGTGLHWPALDLDLYVPSLLRNIYGMRRWMAEMGTRGGSTKSVAKREASRANGLKGGRPRKALAS